MDQRRVKKREEKYKEHEKKVEKDHKDIQSQFSDLKRHLVNITRNDWEALPDAPDLVKKTKRQRVDTYQRYTPVPDSVLNQAKIDAQTATMIDTRSGTASSINGF